AWATNLWARIPLYAGNTTTSGTPAVTDGPGTANSRAFTSRVGLTAITDGSVRATLAIMAASMAYMLLAMQREHPRLWVLCRLNGRHRGRHRDSTGAHEGHTVPAFTGSRTRPLRFPPPCRL